MNSKGSAEAVCGYKCGALPSCAPLAAAFVPAQENAQAKYEPDKALARGDAEAFAAYQDLLRLAEEGAQRYAKLYGPITKRDLLNAETYTWLKSPWPWEYRGGTEG